MYIVMALYEDRTFVLKIKLSTLSSHFKAAALERLPPPYLASNSTMSGHNRPPRDVIFVSPAHVTERAAA